MAWQIDATHSHVGFSVKHMMVSTVRGQFKQYTGTLHIDGADFSRSKFEGEVDVASIDTGNSQRDDHLRSGDFFDAGNHPKIKFASTRIESKGDGEFIVHGDLTIRGTTLPVALDVEYQGTGKNPWGKTVTGFSAKTTIFRVGGWWELKRSAIVEPEPEEDKWSIFLRGGLAFSSTKANFSVDEQPQAHGVAAGQRVVAAGSGSRSGTGFYLGVNARRILTPRVALIGGVDYLRGPKIKITNYHSKTGYRRRMGYRHELTKVRVTGHFAGK